MKNKNKDKNILKINVNDIILTAFFVVICLALILISVLNAIPGEKVQIFVENELFKEEKVSQNAEIAVNDKLTVIIENKNVFVINSTCENCLCENMPPIKNKGESIICLPNKIIIKIAGEGYADAVSG